MRSLFEKAYRFRYLVYAILIGIVYANSVHAPFYFDDSHSIADNSALRTLSNWYQFWFNPDLSSSLPSNRSYRPFTFMVYNWLSVMGGGSTVPFHIHKLLLLFGICVLIEKIWNLLFATITKEQNPMFGFSLACLWAVHPALSEATVYITASASLQTTFFYFLAFWFFIKTPSRLLLTLVFYAASCFSKEEGITLPAVLFLWFWLNGQLKERWKPIAFLGMVGAILFVFIQTRIPAVQSVSRGNVPPFDYLLTQIRAWVWYQKIWFWPNDLNADNTVFGFSHSIKEPSVVICFFLQLALTALIWIKRKSFPLIFFGWLWFYISISPASSFIPLAEPVNERRMLTAYLGFTGAVHFILWSWARRYLGRFRNLVSAAFVSVLVVAAVTTYNRVLVWKDAEALWSDTVKKNPGSVRALNNLASVQVTNGDYESALANTRACLAISPYIYCMVNQGISLAQLGKYEEAKNIFIEATTNDWGLATPHYYFADYWFRISEYNKALQEVEKALQITGGTYQPALDLKNKILPLLEKK